MAQSHAQSGGICPCGSGRGYAACCGVLHAGVPAIDAASLMRSRYSAYVFGLHDYLLQTWAPETRPQASELAVEPGTQRPTWLGLKLHAQRLTGSDSAEVEFTARFRIGGGSAQRMRERSRFRRDVDGRWYYINGDVDAA